MQRYELRNILHLLVLRHLVVTEQPECHLLANDIMVVESPLHHRVPTLCLGLAYVVQQCCPAEPQVVGLLCDVVKYLECVVEHLLVAVAASCLHTLHGCELREDELQQPATVKLYEALGRCGGEHYLVELVVDSLA